MIGIGGSSINDGGVGAGLIAFLNVRLCRDHRSLWMLPVLKFDADLVITGEDLTDQQKLFDLSP